jgi:hypothetical protein
MAGTRFSKPEGVERLNLVVNYLIEHGASSNELIGALLAITPKSALVYLHRLRVDGRAHRRAGTKLWAAGPDQKWFDVEQGAPDTSPKRRCFAYYQTGRARRDPLVEALFGPAQPAPASNDSTTLAQA